MANHRLLLVEDDYDVAEMLIMYFESHNYEVIHADTGTGGVELARTKFPNLILLDVMLPHMDGYDVCLNLRNMAMTKYIPILFLTQRDERASKVKGLELGADDYITKPFDIDELRLRVQGAINRATRENLHEVRTGLPTGPMIHEEIHRKQSSGHPFVALIYTIEGYKSYADHYGFMAAKDVINRAGACIQQVVGIFGTDNDFVGIDNDTDDFIVLTHSADVDGLDAAIKEKFNAEAPAFYSFMDADRGGLVMHEGTAHEYLEPLMTFSSQKRSLADIAG